MTASLHGEEPLTPVHPFNQPGEPVILHEGAIGGLTGEDVHGRVELSCAPNLSLEWSITSGAPLTLGFQDDVTLLLRRPQGDVQMQGVPRNSDCGWSGGVEAGNAHTPLKRIIAHWFNLPKMGGPIKLEASDTHRRHWWAGRWVGEFDGWKVTIDKRPDYTEATRNLHREHPYLMTHVMELRRADGRSFNAVEAKPVLDAIHVSVSFAVGRWAAPALPTGEGEDGTIVWQSWGPSLCDPVRTIASGWWYEADHASLSEFLKLAIPALQAPAAADPLKLQMKYAISATRDHDFVEQRIMIGAAGLEHFMWQALVLSGRLTEKQYRGRELYQGSNLSAHGLLRLVLSKAATPVDVDANLLPATGSFVSKEVRRQGATLDGAAVVTQIRNRLVHPKGNQEKVYADKGLITEAWLLTRHYLVLLILHSLGYEGSYRDLRKVSGWAGDIDDVPWNQ